MRSFALTLVTLLVAFLGVARPAAGITPPVPSAASVEAQDTFAEEEEEEEDEDDEGGW